MLIPKELTKAIIMAKQELRNNNEGELILPIRKKVYSLFGKYQSEIGKKRRAKLEALCVEHAMVAWNATQVKSPLDLLSNLEECYQGKISWDDLFDLREDYWTDMDDLGEEIKYQQASLVGYAAVETLIAAENDLEFGEDDENPEALDDDFDPFGWESSYYASGAIAGYKWIKGASKERRRQFWEWYLNKAVPEAYLSYSE